jgi:hypothetical protein
MSPPCTQARRHERVNRLILFNHLRGLHVFPGAGVAALDTVSAARLLSRLVVRYMTVSSYKEQMSRISNPLFIICVKLI